MVMEGPGASIAVAVRQTVQSAAGKAIVLLLTPLTYVQYDNESFWIFIDDIVNYWKVDHHLSTHSTVGIKGDIPNSVIKILSATRNI